MAEKGEIIELYKDLGETPLECIIRFKAGHPEFRDTKMTYLGRLDPMAEGLLLVLAGDTRAKKEYLDMDKTYEFEVLWGFETDTYDILGLVTSATQDIFALYPQVGSDATHISRVASLLKNIRNKKTQEYPPYSSRTVDGKPLFEWAREKRIEEIDVPTRGIKIFSIEHIHSREISQKEMLHEIVSKINLVKGDFRQSESIEGWQNSIDPEGRAMISKFKADVSSGTYIRGLAHEMGQILSSSALAYTIKRTRVGEYKLDARWKGDLDEN